MTTYTVLFVSVLTPTYNMGPFLADCIEGVLKSTYENFEYIMVNNCSTDQSLEIASSYAKMDSRIRVHNNDTFVGVIANHNNAFGLMSGDAKYCKVVSADDLLLPECIACDWSISLKRTHLSESSDHISSAEARFGGRAFSIRVQCFPDARYAAGFCSREIPSSASVHRRPFCIGRT